MKAEKRNLEDLLISLRNGEIQLPDFQRDWTWDDDKIKSLLESVIRGFPINSILLLECNADDRKFSPRPIEGVTKPERKPEFLILDGQQRLTSLYGALFSDDDPVTVKRGKTDKKFFYYVDMQKAVAVLKDSADVEDLIVSVPATKKLKSKGANLDLSKPEGEYKACMFPLKNIFDKNVMQWLWDCAKFHSDDAEKQNIAMEFNNIVKEISKYEVAIIQLEKNISLAAVCKIFENANKGVEKLKTFDLLTSIFAGHVDANGQPIKLRTDWEKIHETFTDNNLDILDELDASDFITALTLLVSYKNRGGKRNVSCKAEDILNLSYEDYISHKAEIIDGFLTAGNFLATDGLTLKKYLPYKTQLIPMAAIFAELKSAGKDNAATRNKIRQWYWCCVFSESYKDGQGTRYAKDIVQVMRWIDKREEPEILRKAQIVSGRLLAVSSVRSAAYKGMISLILRNGATDFLAGRSIGTDTNLGESEVHHIFPKKYCEARGIPKSKYDSIANKTLIMRGTNRTIGGDPPSIYLSRIQQKTGLTDAELDEILKRHFIDAALCRADDFDAFLADRTKKIFDEIEKLTGRKVVGRNA